MTAVPAVQAAGLTRRFGPRVAVAGVDLTLDGGECLALFGPNGAGKTTLLRMLAGLLKPTSGEARIGGHAAGLAARRLVGLLSHQSMLYGALTARENVEFAARLHGVARPRQAAAEALERLRVADRAEVAVRALSRGLQQRVSIARAMVHDPRVVLLDEPFSGLDDVGAGALTAALEGLVRSGATLVLVTHNLAEGLALATRVAVMRDGRIISAEARGSIDPPAYAARYRTLVAHGA